MTIKLFEIRDRATFLPALAIKLGARNEAERYLLSRSGYGKNAERHSEYVILWRLEGGVASYNPYQLGGGPRTMPVAHDYISRHFDALESGSVVCVQHILGERPAPKESEASYAPDS